MRNKVITAVLVLVFLISVLGTVSAAELKGEEIMKKVYNRETGDSRTSNLEMILINRHGAERIREIKQYEKDFGDAEKKIMFFISPADVRNTSFMNWSYDSKQSDDQWIFLPALNKVKRISSENKSEYFMGSDFTYDDMKSREIDDFEYELLEEDVYNNYETYVVKATPKKPEEEQYAKTISWITKEHYIPVKVEMYDKDSGELYKEMKVKSDIKKIDGIWTVFSTVMENLDSGHKTNLYVKKRDNNYLLEYNSDINNRRFTQQFLKTGR